MGTPFETKRQFYDKNLWQRVCSTRSAAAVALRIARAGVDTLSLDVGSARKFVAHLALLGAGKDAIELMANLSTVPAAGTMLIVGGPKHEGASGGPVRGYAVA